MGQKKETDTTTFLKKVRVPPGNVDLWNNNRSELKIRNYRNFHKEEISLETTAMLGMKGTITSSSAIKTLLTLETRLATRTE